MPWPLWQFYLPGTLSSIATMFSVGIEEKIDDLDAMASFCSELKQDVDRWLHKLFKVNGSKFSARTPDMVIYSGALLTSWRMFSSGTGASGSWSVERNLHINSLDFLAAFYAVKVFAKHTENLLIHSKYTTADVMSLLPFCIITVATLYIRTVSLNLTSEQSSR